MFVSPRDDVDESVGSVDDYHGVSDYCSVELSIPAKACYLLTSRLPNMSLYISDALVVSEYSFGVRYGSLVRDYSPPCHTMYCTFRGWFTGAYVQIWSIRAETPRGLHTFRLEVVG